MPLAIRQNPAHNTRSSICHVRSSYRQTAKSLEDAAAALSAPLRRYLERLVGDAATAQDLLQETLMRVSRGLPGFKGQSSLQTSAFSIGTRVVAGHFRRPETKVSVVGVDESESLPDLAPDLDQQLVVDEMNACVRGVSTVCQRTTVRPSSFTTLRGSQRRKRRRSPAARSSRRRSGFIALVPA